MGTVSEKLQKSKVQCWRFFTEVVISKMMCIFEQTLNARTLTPVSSDVNDSEAMLLGNKNVCLPYQPCAEDFVDHRKLFLQNQDYSILLWDRFFNM